MEIFADYMWEPLWHPEALPRKNAHQPNKTKCELQIEELQLAKPFIEALFHSNKRSQRIERKSENRAL